MKFIFSLLLFTVVNATAQTIKMDTLTYEQTQDPEFCKKFPRKLICRVYKTKEGSCLKIGDTLVVGTPAGNSQRFTRVYLGKFNPIGYTETLNTMYSAEKIIITEINPFKMNQKGAVVVNMFAVSPSLPKSISNRTVTNYEQAVEVGEISNLHRKMTKGEAIAKLKEQRELLELGLVTEAQYDSLKSELRPILVP
jgi:hypothetical protein